MTRNILILYGTSYGQTALISRRIGDQLSALGYHVTLVRGDDPQLPAPDSFDGVIVGASLIRGKHQQYVRQYVERHREALEVRPAAFFSVSASAASSDEAGRADARRALEAFLDETGWAPSLTATIAGAIDYRKYGVFTRWMLRRISAKSGGPTDTSRNHELTDWEQVERLVDEFTELPGLKNSRSVPGRQPTESRMAEAASYAERVLQRS